MFADDLIDDEPVAPARPPDFRGRPGQADAALLFDLFALRIGQAQREGGKFFPGGNRLLCLVDIEISDGKSGADESGGKRCRDKDELRLHGVLEIDPDLEPKQIALFFGKSLTGIRLAHSFAEDLIVPGKGGPPAFPRIMD